MLVCAKVNAHLTYDFYTTLLYYNTFYFLAYGLRVAFFKQPRNGRVPKIFCGEGNACVQHIKLKGAM